jgi:hypothetical protein
MRTDLIVVYAGLSLTKEQFNSVLALADQIKAAIQELE